MMPETRVRAHQWVLHIICPVEVIPGDYGAEPNIFVDPDKRQAAEENAVYGCMACSAPLTRMSAPTECPGGDVGD